MDGYISTRVQLLQALRGIWLCEKISCVSFVRGIVAFMGLALSGGHTESLVGGSKTCPRESLYGVKLPV